MTDPGQAAAVAWWQKALAAPIALLGLGEAAGGAWLVGLGGSPYYLLAGLIVAAAAVAAWRDRSLGRMGFHLFIVLTLAWALFETRGEFWGMLSRLGYPIALWLAGLLVTSAFGGRRARLPEATA